MQATNLIKSHKTIAIFSCALAMIFCGMDYFIQVSPGVLVYTFMKEFKISAADLGILGAVFYYAYMLMQIPAGLILDQYGTKKILFIAILVTAAGIILLSYSNTFLLLALSRFVMGLGFAFAFLSALHFAAGWFDNKHFPLMAGITQSTVSIGSMLGGLPLIWLSAHFGWRKTFFDLAIVMCILAVFVALLTQDGVQRKRSRQKAPKHWLINLKMIIKHKKVWWIASCSLISWLPVTVVGALWGVTYLIQVYHVSNIKAATLLLPLWLGVGIGSPLIGVLANHVRDKKNLLISAFIVGSLGASLLLLAPFLPFYIILLALFFLGISASVQAFSFSFIKYDIPYELFGVASGINNLFAILGAGLGQLLSSSILHCMWSGETVKHLPVYTTLDYQMALIIIPAALLVGVFIARYKL